MKLKRARYDHKNRDMTVEDRYNPDGAEERYQKLLKQKGKRGKLLPDKELLRLLEQKIMTEKYSPGEALAYNE